MEKLIVFSIRSVFMDFLDKPLLFLYSKALCFWHLWKRIFFFGRRFLHQAAAIHPWQNHWRQPQFFCGESGSGYSKILRQKEQQPLSKKPNQKLLFIYTFFLSSLFTFIYYNNKNEIFN